jgi:hypothetical protein
MRYILELAGLSLTNQRQLPFARAFGEARLNSRLITNEIFLPRQSEVTVARHCPTSFL